MDLRTYRFSSTFTLESPRKRVHEVLVDLELYADWWPQVRAVAKIDDDHAIVLCRSTLPYTLELVLSAVSRDVDLLEVGIDGPIRGWARFRLDEQGPGRTSLGFEQEGRAEAPMFVLASYVVRPLLVWNHHRMVAGLQQGLRTKFAPAQPSAATAAS